MKHKNVLTWMVVSLVVVLTLAELWAKFWWKLGDPPLSIADARIDYLFAPNQDCHRFGNRIIYNDASMRCDFNVLNDGLKSVDPSKRILVIGDSVINGGVLTDHEKLATTILQRTHPDYAIMNISAGSWGPGNYLAYLEKFGSFGAQTLVLEVNSHDIWEDDPIQSAGRYVGEDISLPNEKPLCALTELICRYVIPKIKRKLHISTYINKVDVPRWSENASGSVEYNTLILNKLLAFPWKRKVLLVHRSRAEAYEAVPSEGEELLMDIAKKNGAECILFKTTAEDYRDTIHLSVMGQKHLAEFLEITLMEDKR